MRKNQMVQWLLVLLGAVALFAPSTKAAQGAVAENVILLMLDGVRWQEVYKGDAQGMIFRNLWRELAAEGLMFGNRDQGAPMTVSNGTNISLPAYQSIMAGFRQDCGSNGCGRIRTETLQERLLRELGGSRLGVATIASWEKIPHAVEHRAGATFVNAAFEPLADGTKDPELDEINLAQTRDLPLWKGARFDRYTWAHSMRYLARHKPRFLFISLNDADEWAHRGEWSRYVEALRQYDGYLRELVAALKSMGEYGQKTMLIVTTDHGRGEGGNWKHHGWIWPSSRFVWMYARGARSAPSGSATQFTEYTHNDIRPTIEAALGIRPVSCSSCGQVITELVPGYVSPPRGRPGS